MLYPIAIEIGSDTEAYGVVFPDVAGCFSAGDTLDEAVRNAKEALELHLEVMADDGLLPPNSTEIHEHDHINNPDYAGWVWALVEINLGPYLGKASKINVTLPNLLTKKIDQAVAANPSYQNRSHFLQVAALNELAK